MILRRPETTSVRERPTSKRAGVACGVGAYVVWGLVPIYFKQVAALSPAVVLAHRVVWSVLFLAILVTAQRLWADVWRCFRSKTLLLALAGSTIAVAANPDYSYRSVNRQMWLFLWCRARETDA